MDTKNFLRLCLITFSVIQSKDENFIFQISSSADDIMPTIAQSTPDLDSNSVSGTANKLMAKAKRFSPSMKIKNIKGKSTSDSKIQDESHSVNNRKSTSLIDQLLKSDITIPGTGGEPSSSAVAHLQDLTIKLERHETTKQEYSILEKCIKQYEMFFQVYLSSNVLHLRNMSNRSGARVPTSICSVTVNLVNDSNDTMKLSQNVIVEDDCPERKNEISRLFETLKINEISRTAKLNHLLHKTIMKRGSASASDYNSDSTEYKDCTTSTEKLNDETVANTDDGTSIDKTIQRLMQAQPCESLRNCVKLASALLVEMSTFPNYNQNMVNSVVPIDVPIWLKVLVLVACYCKSDKELQIGAIQTLFDLIGLLKSQIEHSTNPGVTYVVMLPLLKSGHVSYLEFKTRTIQVCVCVFAVVFSFVFIIFVYLFQVIISSLWDYLNESFADSSQVSSLLYQLHSCLPSGIVENVIGHRIANTHLEWSDSEYYDQCDYNCPLTDDRSSVDRTTQYKRERLSGIRILCTPPTYLPFNCNEYLSESDAERFKKFELLWEHGREAGQNTKGFEKTLLKIFDHLTLPNYVSIRTFVTKWFQESLLRGDINRLIRPLLKILLANNTKRISVLHAHLIRRTVADANDSDSMLDNRMDDADGTDSLTNERDVYAISSEDGNIKYHMEMASNKHKKSPIRSLQKKFFGVTISNKNKTSNYISDKTIASPTDASVMIGQSISLIVNPLDSSSDLDVGKSDGPMQPGVNVASLSLAADESPQLSSSQPNRIEITSPAMDIGGGGGTQASSGSVKEEDDYYSSCEEETDDESFSETESDRHDESLDRELIAVVTSSSCPQPSSDMQRFSGDCERVSELLTEHDRTKNRKTYNVSSIFILFIFSCKAFIPLFCFASAHS